MYDSKIGRWLTQDRFAEKYTNVSPYAYCVNNPLKYVDPTGDSIYIEHQGNSYLYNDGKLYLNGSEYTGSTDGFLGAAYNALNEIGADKFGADMVNELATSENKFFLVDGNGVDSKFEHSNIYGAYEGQYKETGVYDKYPSKFDGKGAGGTITWNSAGKELPTTKGTRINAVTDLAHEMFHGFDANRGMLNDIKIDDLAKHEWQAVYNENIIRRSMGRPLRTYSQTVKDPDGNLLNVRGPYMLTANGEPIKPAWYK